MIPVFRPSMDEEEIEAVAATLRSGWIGLGPKTKEFEEKIAGYLGVKYAVGVNSCTEALHLALVALGVKSGEIITTPITFVSTAHAVLYVNAKPVFADVHEDTINIDPADIKRKITKRTKAIIPVHYGGHACEMDEILQLASEHDLSVIEDAAHGMGAEYKGKKLGAIGDVGCFSFHAVKNLATGDGGVITTNDQRIYEQLLKLRWLGISQSTYKRSVKGYSWYYDVECLGYKSHMNDITASIGLVQLSKLDKANSRRREIFKCYNEQFKKLDWIETPVEKEYTMSSLHNYVIKVNENDRNELIAYLAKKGIAAGVHYMPLYLHSFYKKMKIEGNCPVADRVWKKLVTLPLYPDMTSDDIELVIKTVKSYRNERAHN